MVEKLEMREIKDLINTTLEQRKQKPKTRSKIAVTYVVPSLEKGERNVHS